MPIERPFKQGADFEHFRQVLMRETKDGPVPIVEMMVDGSIMGRVTGMDYPVDQLTELIELFFTDKEISEETITKGVKLQELIMAFTKAVGYDSLLSFTAIPVPHTKAQYSRMGSEHSSRPWQNEHGGLISSRADFDAFPWPDPSQINVGVLDFAAQLLEPGMKIHSMQMGIFEDLRALMGFEPMAIKSIEEPDLLDDILEKLTVLVEKAVGLAAAHPATGVVYYADDMGFKTSTMLSPDFFRQHIIPRQKRIADACHEHGKPFIFHSCGNIDPLMEDLINEVGIDGIHSFEDVIEPVEEVYRRYGDRISVLGGVDVGLLAMGTVEQVRARVREILDVCGHGGGFAIGSGNSVTNYCKVENFYAMIDEARTWNQEQGYL